MSSWQMVAPTVVEICDLFCMQQMGGARVLWVLVCSDAEQARALLLKSGFGCLLARLFCRSNTFHQKMSY